MTKGERLAMELLGDDKYGYVHNGPTEEWCSKGIFINKRVADSLITQGFADMDPVTATTICLTVKGIEELKTK